MERRQRVRVAVAVLLNDKEEAVGFRIYDGVICVNVPKEVVEAIINSGETIVGIGHKGKFNSQTGRLPRIVMHNLNLKGEADKAVVLVMSNKIGSSVAVTVSGTLVRCNTGNTVDSKSSNIVDYEDVPEYSRALRESYYELWAHDNWMKLPMLGSEQLGSKETLYKMEDTEFEDSRAPRNRDKPIEVKKKIDKGLLASLLAITAPKIVLTANKEKVNEPKQLSPMRNKPADFNRVVAPKLEKSLTVQQEKKVLKPDSEFVTVAVYRDFKEELLGIRVYSVNRGYCADLAIEQLRGYLDIGYVVHGIRDNKNSVSVLRKELSTIYPNGHIVKGKDAIIRRDSSNFYSIIGPVGNSRNVRIASDRLINYELYNIK